MSTLSEALGAEEPKKNGFRLQPSQILYKLSNTGKIGTLLPGFLLSLAIAALSIFIEGRLGGPVMLYALVLGVMCHLPAMRPAFAAGLSFSAGHLLKVGVALLGAKITVVDVANLGIGTAALVIAGVTVAMIIGTGIGRVLGLKKDHSVLSAGAVAICGSSAALAISSVLPQSKDAECNTIMTVIVVTTLSTIAMVLYPFIAMLLNLSDAAAGIFMGVSIHNVAQVVGAGYVVSDGAGEIAMIVKLMRVACLVPVIVIIKLMFRGETKQAIDGSAVTKKLPLLPVFMVGFICIVLINSAGYIPTEAARVLSVVSRWALIAAVAALGVKTSLKDLIGVGIRPVLVLTVQTAFLAIFALGALMLIMTV
jgi:uncharacterized integral membrane protein (TIGR00698 family)